MGPVAEQQLVAVVMQWVADLGVTVGSVGAYSTRGAVTQGLTKRCS